MIKKFHYHLCSRPHQALMSNGGWYSNWHNHPLSTHFHLTFLFLYLVGVISGVYLSFSGVLKLPSFATASSSITKDTDTDFNLGTTSSAVISGTGSAATVQLASGGGPDGIKYKKTITINNASNSATLSAYQVNVTLDTNALINAGKLQSNCADFRFRDSNDTTNLSYWVENCNSTSSAVWVKVSTISASTTTNINMYYGSSTASAQSSASATFVREINSGSVKGAWRLDETVNGSPAVDYSGSNNTGTSTGTTASSSGKFHYARYFNGTGDYIDSGNGSSLRIIGNLTLAAWVNPGSLTQTSTYKVLTKHGGAGSYGYQLYIGNGTNSKVAFGVSSNGNDWNSTAGTTSLQNGQWYYIVGVYNGSTLSIYVNGIQEGAPTPYSGGVFNTSSNLAIGRSFQETNAYFLGQIDEPRVYSKALTQSEISDLYNNYGYVTPNYLNKELVRKFSSPEPIVSSIGSETTAYSYSGTWESPNYDFTWNGGWGDGAASSTAFSSTVASVSATDTITFAMKTATSTSALSTAAYVTIGTASAGTTFTKTKADLDTLGLGTGTNRYVKIKATFAQTDNTTPSLDNFTLYYLSDNSPPTNPTTTLGYSTSGKATSLTSDNWYNYATPYFEWSGAADSESGVDGYYVYFGTDNTANPVTAGNYQTGANYTASSLSSGSTYYLLVKTKDTAGNIISSTYSAFMYKFDSTAPTNPSYITPSPAGYSSTNSYTFIWPAGNDSNSGISQYCYKTG
ncbi:MAG: DUF2341 domain-containing protein, partial [Patescibacteria group bacterium]|nr:DUF2341 domain-containing protein [Patescibacteria group bacterium]